MRCKLARQGGERGHERGCAFAEEGDGACARVQWVESDPHQPVRRKMWRLRGGAADHGANELQQTEVKPKSRQNGSAATVFPSCAHVNAALALLCRSVDGLRSRLHLFCLHSFLLLFFLRLLERFESRPSDFVSTCRD